MKWAWPVLLMGASLPAWASTPPTQGRVGALSDRLTGIREQVIQLEQSLIGSLKQQKEARANLKKVQTLIKLQREERELGKRRMAELEKTVSELERRRGALREKIAHHKKAIRRALIDMNRSAKEQPRTARLPERESVEAPRRKVLANMAEHGLKEIETIKVDLADADQLEARILDERQQLAYLFQDLQEQASLLELNQQIQLDLLKKRHADRVSQLENYRRLKGAESEVEKLISDFNARVELERAMETERVASQAMRQGDFANLKGLLPLPIPGRIVSQFGRVFDAKTNLHIFKKGVDIAAGRIQPVRAVAPGKIAYSGELPNYGRVVIVDHGEHFYTLCAHLGDLKLKAGDPVAAGDSVGQSDDAGTPVYFEIRARNIAVNPLQWVSN